MPEPAKFSPLESYRERWAALSGEQVEIREGPFLTQIDLRGDVSAGFGDAVQAVTGCGLPSAANTVVRYAERGRSVLWLGPDEWLIVAGSGEANGLVADLQSALANRHISIVDVSANRTVVELSGKGARDVLAQGCSLDLHPRAFTTDHCAQTLLTQVPVIIEQLDDVPTFRLYVRPSFSRYIADWLLEAASLA